MLRATEIPNRRTGPPEEGWAVVYKVNYPRIFDCFEMISHDGGSGAGHERYVVPPKWLSSLPLFEHLLGVLTDEERREFCIGDYDNIIELVKRHPPLSRVGAMLNEFFEDWGTEDTIEA